MMKKQSRRDWLWETELVGVDIEQLADNLDDHWRGYETFVGPHSVVDKYIECMPLAEFLTYVAEVK